MSAVIASSIYFLLTNNPKYSAWNKEQVYSRLSLKKVPLFTCFKTQAKSEDREYTHTGLVFAAILAIASLVPVAGGAILHVIRRCGIKFLCPVTIVFHPGCRTRTITSPR